MRLKPINPNRVLKTAIKEPERKPVIDMNCNLCMKKVKWPITYEDDLFYVAYSEEKNIAVAVIKDHKPKINHEEFDRMCVSVIKAFPGIKNFTFKTRIKDHYHAFFRGVKGGV
jgi:hypothetical protein